MHNQSGITQNSYSYSNWQVSSGDLLQNRLARKFFSKEALHRFKHIGGNILAALTVGTLVLGEIYFFLVQLANHGW